MRARDALTGCCHGSLLASRGVLGLVFALAGLGLVVAMRIPGALVVPETHALYQSPALRIGLLVLLLAGFGLSALSLALRPGKILGTCGVVATLLAVTLGGPQATQTVSDVTPLYFGLDFFVLRILFTGLLFIPIERLFAQHQEQHVFRPEWREDLFYFLVSSLLVQILTFFTYLPAKTRAAWTGWPVPGCTFSRSSRCARRQSSRCSCSGSAPVP